MKLRILLVTAIGLFWGFTASAQLLQWNTFGNVGTEMTEPSFTNNANVSAANLSLGSIAPVANANRFGGNSWWQPGHTVGGSTLADVVPTSDYITFTVTPNAGYSFTATSLVFGWDHSNTGPSNVTLRSSADGYTTNLGSVLSMPAAQSNANTITISGLANISTATTFRLYGYGGSDAAGTGGFDTAANAVNVVLNGTTTLTPVISAQNGDWDTPATWIGGVVPTSAQAVIINHSVNVTTSITRNAGTTTTVNTSASLNVSGNYQNNGATTINGTFSFIGNASALGNSYVYGPASTLIVTVQGNANSFLGTVQSFWPSANGPFNVTVNASPAGTGFAVMASGMARTINGTLLLNDGINFAAASPLTLNGTILIGAGGYFDTNAPIYGPGSTLQYQSGGTYGRGFEWNAAGVGTIGTTPGYPNNIVVTAFTTLNYVNTGTPGIVGPKALAGNLTINAGSALYMDYGGISPGGTLSVAGNLDNAGSISLGTVYGDDLRLGGNFSNTGTFTHYDRAFFFYKTSGTQTISSTTAFTIPYLFFEATGSRTVQLLSNLIVSAPSPGTALSFGSAADIFDINGNTLTIGTTGWPSSINGSGTFKGSAASNMSLIGSSFIGTIGFTTGFQTLGSLTINRTGGATAGAWLGTPLTVENQLILTNGKLNVRNNPLTLGLACNVTSSTTNYIIADYGNGSNPNAALRRIHSGAATNFLFPIGDNAGNYSPVTYTLGAGTYAANAYSAANVTNVKPIPFDSTTDYINRYWQINTSGITGATLTSNGQYVAADVNTPAEASYLGNRWDGSLWSNGGGLVDAVAHRTNNIPCVVGATNVITAGIRDPEINVKVVSSGYADNSTYAFGNQAVGMPLSVTFTIENLGQQTLAFTAGTVAGAAFAFQTPWSNLPSVSGPSGSRTFVITFTPPSAGPFTGSVTINNNDPSGSENVYVINFTGTGFIPAPEINILGGGNTLTTGNTPLGFTDTVFTGQTVLTTSAAKTYTIQNLGTATLTLSGATPFVALSGANPGDFAVLAVPASSIAAAGSTTFSITFTPTQIGTRTATVTVLSNDGDESSYIFYLSGTGTGPEIDVSGNGVSIPSGSTAATTLNDTQFGNANIATGTVLQTFTISNIGNASLSVTAVSITGPDAADFVLASPTGVIAGNSAFPFSVTFNPSTIGVKNAVVTITNSDNNENPYTFAIQGTGVDYIPCALGPVETIAIQDFEPVPATPTMTFSFTQQAGAGVAGVFGGQARGISRTVDSNKFIGTQSFQAAGHLANSGTELATTIDFATIDASAYAEVAFNFRVGGYSTNNIQGVDGTPEFVAVYISTNNGATWSQEIGILGSNNSIWDINNTNAASNTNFDGNNITTNIQAGNNSVNTASSSYTISNLPSASQLKVRIVLIIDRLDEVWSIDEVKFRGKKPAISTWNGTTWLPSTPTSSTFAIIDAPYNTTSGNVNACSCQINSGNTVTINANQYFDIQSDIANSGTVNVANNGSLIQRNDTAVNTGTAFNIARTTTPYKKFDYTYWSSPVTNAVIATVFPTWRLDYAFQFATANYADVIAPFNGFDDNGNAWQNISGIMVQGKGYAIMAPTTGTFPATASVTFSGAVNNGAISIPVVLSANAVSNTDDFNLIGNPYPSALYADAFIDLNAIQNSRISGTLYFWTHRTAIATGAPGPNASNFITADYAMYNLSGSVGTGSGNGSGTGSSAPTGKIASCQGFFVDAALASNVIFNNAMRDESYANSDFFRTSETGPQKDRVWLNFENQENELFSQQLIAYFDDTTLDFDVAYDGIVSKTSNAVSFYSFIGIDNYRIQARPAFDTNDQVPLGYSTTVASNFTISINQLEGQLDSDQTQVYLEDKTLNIVHDLKQSSYSFFTDAGTFDERFILRYIDGLLGTPGWELQDAVLVTTSANAISIKSQGQHLRKVLLYDMTGKLIFERSNILDNHFEISNIVKNNQTLVVKIELADGQFVNRKLVF